MTRGRVLLPANALRGRAQNALHNFHDNRGAPVKYHSLRQDDQWYSVYCFAEASTAEAFHLLFGGQLLKAQSTKN